MWFKKRVVKEIPNKENLDFKRISDITLNNELIEMFKDLNEEEARRVLWILLNRYDNDYVFEVHFRTAIKTIKES
ncbi:hypothetical protein D3C80_2098890 [compost metagenome]